MRIGNYRLCPNNDFASEDSFAVQHPCVLSRTVTNQVQIVANHGSVKSFGFRMIKSRW
jgi:hypothetical protein